MVDPAELELAEGVLEVLGHEDRLEYSPMEGASFWGAAGPEVAHDETEYPGGAGQPQRVRIYRGGDASSPSLLYFHGGGWVMGSIEENDYSSRALAAGGLNVVAVSYRLAPKHPYPAPLDDCRAALSWLIERGASAGLEGPVAIGGTSAGANLAVAASLAEGGAPVAGMLLLVGVFSGGMDTESYLRYSEGIGLTSEQMREFFDAYDPVGARASDPLISPLLADDLSSLPQARFVIAEHDVLRDDSVAMAAAMRKAGVEVTEDLVAGVPHSFVNRGRLLPASRQALGRAAAWVAALGR